MTGRLLCCSLEGIKQVKRALIRNSLAQKALAEELGITRQPVGKFFTGNTNWEHLTFANIGVSEGR